MQLKIKQNAAENYIVIDGTRFDIPADNAQRDGIRELVVNHYCRVNGYAETYPNATQEGRI